jgi:hypothetical protein
MQFLSNKHLAADGYAKSSSQIFRDRKAGLFPPAVRIGNSNLTVSEEFEVFKLVMKARRDYPKLADKLTEWLQAEKKGGRNPWSQDKLDAFIQSNGKEK